LSDTITGRPFGPPAPSLPHRGDTVERFQTGVRVRGRVFYADELQILVKWDEGTSSSLRVGSEQLRDVRVVESRDGAATDGRCAARLLEAM
jgi:hypothetical protein